MISLKLDHKFYLFGRGAATTLALLFALYYSNELGVLNRSYLVMIMTSSVLIGITMTSGTTLTIRNLGLEKNSKNSLASFHSLIFIELFIGCILFFAALLVFSEIKYQLHPRLIMIAIAYYLLSISHLIVLELLLAYAAFKFLAVSEILTIVLQLSLFYFFSNLIDISIASKVLFSFILSYLTISGIAIVYLRNTFGYSIFFGNPLIFFRMTKGNHTVGTVLGIVDRFDRLIIAWFLPISLLGKYAVMSSAISFFRFIPEAFAKLLVSTKSAAWRKILDTKYILIGILVLTSIAVLVLQTLIEFALGSSWLLPLSICYVFALQELARGMFQLLGNYKIAIGKSSQAHNGALFLLLITPLLAYFLSRWKGLIGVPLGFLISYIFVLIIMRDKRQND
jgi:hypothetical protein